jgi:hypothetical protein
MDLDNVAWSAFFIVSSVALLYFERRQLTMWWKWKREARASRCSRPLTEWEEMDRTMQEWYKTRWFAAVFTFVFGVALLLS